MEISLKRRDYHKYCWKKGERAKAMLLCFGVTGFFAYFFYRSIAAMVPLSGVGIFVFRKLQKDKATKEREELALQFRECILAVSTSLQAGYSVENAFLECRQDMALMYGEEASICKELDIIRRGLMINISLEELLLDMADRSGCDDIGQFAQIFALAKRNGGNMAEIIRSSAGQIGKRIELKQEIQTLLGGKQMELRIMEVMPFGIVFYISVGNPGYFDVLYHNLTGTSVMTGCLAVYLGAYFLGKHFMQKIVEQNNSSGR